ncbi:MAG: hypothetical protein GAK29_03399 [Acinetobacter bereziniae]|uniref:Uncharacterized protein n=1 Tax=Acinetobacter bereziniae TaxID=106648 RepID=A0A833PDZ0_ACIBZ|nr:MAG: hypothetical protein GAK29_03399 [Acinetobacter bereziniae]
MGLFDFVKGIGKKNTAPAEPQAAPATPARTFCTRSCEQTPWTREGFRSIYRRFICEL